jgi:hypothetical protein
VAAQPGARVVALSGKDRSAALLAGATAVMPRTGGTRATGASSRRWPTTPTPGLGARGRRDRRALESRCGEALKDRFGVLWRRLLAAPPKRPGAASDAAARAREVPAPAAGHRLRPRLWRTTSAAYFGSFYYSPFIDEVVRRSARCEFLRDPALGLGRGQAPDLLALSFSGNDTVSHSYGRESEETLDALRRLDRQPGARAGCSRRAAEGQRGARALGGSRLPADPRGPPAPAGRAAGRLLYKDLSAPATYYEPTFRDLLNRELAGELCLPGDARPLLDGEGWALVYNRVALPWKTVAGSCGAAGRSVSKAQLDAALQRVIGRLHGAEIEQVLLSRSASAGRATSARPSSRATTSTLSARATAFLFPRPNVIFHWDPARGAHHGSHHDYDTHVPLIFWGGPFVPGRAEADAAPYDLAPTLAALLGVTLPDATGTSARRRADPRSLPARASSTGSMWNTRRL